MTGSGRIDGAAGPPAATPARGVMGRLGNFLAGVGQGFARAVIAAARAVARFPAAVRNLFSRRAAVAPPPPPRMPALDRRQGLGVEREEEQPPLARVRSDSDAEFEARLAAESARARPIIQRAMRDSGLVQDEEPPPAEGRLAEAPCDRNAPLETILNHPQGFRDLRAICERRFCQENPDFWREVETWKAVPDDGPDKLAEAHRIRRDFIDEINITYAADKALRAADTVEEFSRALGAAQQDVLHNMLDQTDILAEFRRQGT